MSAKKALLLLSVTAVLAAQQAGPWRPYSLTTQLLRGRLFLPNRAAVINAAGEIDGASGDPAQCVRVDGTAVACGTGGGGGGGGDVPTFHDGVPVIGDANGSNQTFGLASAPSPAASLILVRNGIVQKPSTDFLLSGTTIVFLSGAIPQTGDAMIAWYRSAP